MQLDEEQCKSVDSTQHEFCELLSEVVGTDPSGTSFKPVLSLSLFPLLSHVLIILGSGGGDQCAKGSRPP